MKLFQPQLDHVGLLILVLLKALDQHDPVDKNYEGGFATALMYKDLGLAVDAANETKSNIQYGLETYKKYKGVTDNNKGNLDFSNIINE